MCLLSAYSVPYRTVIRASSQARQRDETPSAIASWHLLSQPQGGSPRQARACKRNQGEAEAERTGGSKPHTRQETPEGLPDSLLVRCSEESQRRHKRETSDLEMREEQSQALWSWGVPEGEGATLGLAGGDHLCAVSRKAPLSTKGSAPENFHE